MKRWIIFVFLLFVLVGCDRMEEEGQIVGETAVSPTTPAPTQTNPTPTDPPTAQPTEEQATPPTATVDSPTAIPFTGAWPSPAKAYPLFSRQPVTAAEQTSYDLLDQDLPPERDDVLLAVSYRGIEPPAGNPPLVTEPLPVGTEQNLFISNFNTNETSSPVFELRHVSEHGYFWFDTTGGIPVPSESEMINIGEAFDVIYEQVVFYFGPESNPGVDGDPIVHIANASPQTLCGSSSCGLLGYVDSSNFLPTEVQPSSNEREMFVMNGAVYGTETYLTVLAHEFRHMIEERYDVNDTDWEVEGSAMLAEDLLGYSADPISRGNLFLMNPDQQLNRWTDGNSIPYYGQGYVINRYIYNRLGEDLYREFAKSALPGFLAIDEIAELNNLDLTGLGLWFDWLTSLAIHDRTNRPEKYALRDGLNEATAVSITNFPFTSEETVSQYAVDYYEIEGSGDVTLNFTGSNHVPLMQAQPASGASMWVANRANYSNVRLTREFDLTAVSTATLQYSIFTEIEYTYDFGYLAISTDGGQSWQGLVADNMQGDSTLDDPSDVAYTDRFYTGDTNGWVEESVDLTPFVGNEIMIRFEYVTDPILTFGGMAIDNIAIPEIGFGDDAETDAGWTAEGFVRSTGFIPQQWHLQLITFEDSIPTVQFIELSSDNVANLTIPLDNGSDSPILVVAAYAPMTLEPAHYRLDLQR